MPKNKKRDAEQIIDGLRDLVRRSQRGMVETHELLYICNLLENGMIDSYRAGKISREKLDNFLYRDRGEDDRWKK